MHGTEGAATGQSVFSGLRIIDATEGFAGALATMLMADNGAAVARVVGPQDEADDPARSKPGYVQWHRSKAVETIDLRRDEGADRWQVLVNGADALVISSDGWIAQHLPPTSQTHDSLQLLCTARPDLVVCSIDAFEDHPRFGTLRADTNVVHAVSGKMMDYARTFRRNRPVYVAPPQADYAAGMAALQGTAAALYEREQTGQGQHLRTSLLRAFTAFDFWGPHGLGALGNVVALPADHPGPNPMLGYTPARTRDGHWIQWANYAPHLLWEKLKVLGLGHLRDDPDYARLPEADPHAQHTLWERILTATAEKTAAEWMEILTARAVAGGDLFGHTQAAMDHPQARHNGTIVAVDDPVLGATEQIGPIAAFSTTPSSVGITPWSTSARSDARAPSTVSTPASSPRRPPLEGVLVIEAATVIASPWGSAILSDLGARVIKIEPIGGEIGRGLPFIKFLQGKESVTVDLKAPDGLAVAHRLIERADVFLHNYRPGVPQKLGIDSGTLRAMNPRLIYTYAGAYGTSGPYALMPGYHPIAGAIAGAAELQTGAYPQPIGAPSMAELKAESLHRFWANDGHPDPVTGMAVAASMIMALLYRQRFGIGQDIDISMLTANAYLMSDDWIRYSGKPERPTVDAELFGTGPTNRLYRARDGWVFVSAPTERERAAKAELLGAHDESKWGDAIASRSADDLEDAAIARRLGCVRADRMGFPDWQKAEIEAGRTGLACFTHSPQIGEHWRAAAIVAMEGVGALNGANLPGAQTRDVLTEIGYAPDEMASLLQRGIVGEP